MFVCINCLNYVYANSLQGKAHSKTIFTHICNMFSVGLRNFFSVLQAIVKTRNSCKNGFLSKFHLNLYIYYRFFCILIKG